MTDAYTTEILKNISDISTGLDSNGLIVKTRAAVQTGIKKFQITPAEQAKLYANFEMQFSLGVVTKLIDVVIQSGLIEQQIALEKKKVELAVQQILSEVQNTAKATAEVALLGSNKALVDAQVLTETKRRLDAIAGINIKNEQALSTRQSSKFEEARRIVLLKSTEFNNQIQKADKSTALFNAMAIDESFVITEAHLTSVKNDINAITVSGVTYVEELITPVGIVDAGT